MVPFVMVGTQHGASVPTGHSPSGDGNARHRAGKAADVTDVAPAWQTVTVPEHRWTNQSQPQTLQGAVVFSYLNAALAVVYTLLLGLQSFLVVFVLLAVAAYGIANDRKWGYWSGLVLACLYLLGTLVSLVTGGGFGAILYLFFAGILVALLVHPESRNYQRIWFH